MARRRRRGRRSVSSHRPVTEFASGLGYRFRDIGLLEEALTHGSYRNDHEVPDYERLEFVGDAALGLVVTESMHRQRPAWDNQHRQETKSELVSNQSLAGAARTLSLEEGIRVGRGRSAGQEVRSSDRILANVFEAVLGAAYLDGGMPAARGVFGIAFRQKMARLRLEPPVGTPGGAPRPAGLRGVHQAALRFVRRATFRRTATERALGRTFSRREILEAALTLDRPSAGGVPRGRRGGRRRSRRSRNAVRPMAARPNARLPASRPSLRFLGRDVMHLVLAETLHRHFPDWDEGRMTLARMRLQSRDFTRELGRSWSLGADEDAAGSAEAVLGALYVDGGLPAAERAVGHPLRAALEELRNPDLELLDAKTLLQNRLARAGEAPPRYEVRRAARGSGAEGQVSVVLRLASGQSANGTGRGLKEAEKDAAARMLLRLDRRPDRGSRPTRGGSAEPPGAGVDAVAAAAADPAAGASSDRASAGVAAEAASADTAAHQIADNPKGALQEALVRKEGRLPVYRLVSESGPEHEKTYVMEVLAGQRRLGRGVGRSKRKAEAEAAAAALAAGI